MVQAEILQTRLGAVEVTYVPGDKPPVLFFPGGHCSAASDCGWGLYTSQGYAVLAFSRPGYGRTQVGRLDAAAFVPAVAQCCEMLRIDQSAGAVGVSFGGLQAMHAAAALPSLVPRLVLHSCAPSTHPYPDSRLESLMAPVAFSPAVQALTWRVVSRLVNSDVGLRRMVGALSRQPCKVWWPSWSVEDKRRARELFQSMNSGCGFVNDLSQARRDSASDRRLTQNRVACPTLVTASRHDAGVAFDHAEDFAHNISQATLVELSSSSHLFWLGPAREEVQAAVSAFMGTNV